MITMLTISEIFAFHIIMYKHEHVQLMEVKLALNYPHHFKVDAQSECSSNQSYHNQTIYVCGLKQGNGFLKRVFQCIFMNLARSHNSITADMSETLNQGR